MRCHGCCPATLQNVIHHGVAVKGSNFRISLVESAGAGNDVVFDGLEDALPHGGDFLLCIDLVG